MRSLLTLLALALAPAHAQGTPPTTPDAACTTGEIYAGGAPVTPSYRWTEPATAVAAARQQVLSTQWTVTCLTYRIRSDGQRVTIQSLTTNPQDALTPLRPLEFYTSGFYRYPALRLGWTGQRIDVTWNGQQVHVSGQVLDDVILAPAPSDPVHIEALIRTLRAFPLLAGARGQAPVDCMKVAEIATRLGDLMLAHPEIAEVEINPLRATAEGATALDARIGTTH